MIRPIILVVSLLVSSSLFAQGGVPMKTGQKYVTAIVDPGNGWLWFRIFPGNYTVGTLSYYQKSFVSFSFNGKIFTNNDVGLPSPHPNTFIMKDGVLSVRKGQKQGTDTIVCTWPNKDGVDLIQEVYPVLLEKSEQIVLRWKALNKRSDSVVVAVQYLLDIQVGDGNYTNDGAPILTRYGYRADWDMFSSSTGIGVPWFYIAFQYPLPNSPSFDPGLSGMGLTDNTYANLGLIKPIRQTIGNWPDLIQSEWGPPTPLPNGHHDDVATLLEFSSMPAKPNKEALLAATSYGTGEFATCKGQLFGVIFYPLRINWESPNLYPDPFTVDFFAFNPQKMTGAPNTTLSLTVGPNLTITGPSPVTGGGKSQTQIVNQGTGFIPPLGVGTASWTVRPTKEAQCSTDIFSSLKFVGVSTALGYPIFVNEANGSDTCEHPIIIECTNDDKLPPTIDPIIVTANISKQIVTHDDRPVTDKGLKSIAWLPKLGTDSSNFVITIDPAITPCSKLKHTVTIQQKDSTKGGCFDLVFEDCAGNRSDTTVCLEIHVPPPIPDTVAPQIFDDSVLTTRTAYFRISDSSSLDSGIKQIVIAQPVYGVVFDTIIPALTPCSKLVHQVLLTRTDSLHDECIKITLTDCAGNTAVDSVCFKHDTTLGVKNTSDEANFQILGNPSSGRAAVRLTLEKAQDITLKLVDVLGKEVRRYEYEHLQRGMSELPLTLSDIASGTYYLILEIDGKQLTRNIKVIR